TNDMINDIVEIAPQKFIVAQNLEGPRLMEHDRIGPFTSPGNITVNKFYKMDGNRLLAATDRHGMVEWKNNDFHYLNAGYTRNIDDITVLNDSIWVVVQYNTSVQLMTNQLHPYSASNIVNVTAVYTDSQQRTWVGTATGLKLLAPRQQRNKPVAFAATLPPAFDLPVLRDTWIAGFLEDSHGNYWIATAGGGVARIRANGKSTIYTEEDGLPASFINCIWEDQQKNIWVGTPLGLAKFSIGNEVKVFSVKHGLAVTGSGCILPMPANSIRLFSPQNITDLDLQTDHFSNFSSNNNTPAPLFKLNNEEVLQTSNNENKLFISYKGNGEKIQWPGIVLNIVTRIDSENFAGSSNNRVVFISKGKIQGKLVLPPHIIVYAMQPDSNNSIWVASVESGLYKIKWRRDKDSISFLLTDSLTHELPDKHVRSLFKDKENELWIGTRYKGVVRLLEHANGKRELQHYDTEQGLSSNFARTINRDRKGNIWVGTSQGLDKLIPSGDQYRVFNFGKINNIYSSVPRICFLENDYFVTEGQVLVHARDLQQDTLPPPPVYITKISTGSVAYDSTISGPLTRLSYHQPQIYFEFCAPQFISEEWNEYRYRLLGSADTSWTKAPVSKSVYFASLQPGNYTFEVKVLGFNGVWGEPARHHFIVTTPFWQKEWFIALIIAVVAMMVYGLYRYRIRQLMRLQQVRNQIAADLHDEIGSNLTNISILSSLSKKNIAKPQQATDFLQRISEEVAASSQSLDDIIWSVNTNHDTLEETVARMRLYTAELFDGAGIHYELQLAPAFEATKLIMEQRRDIYMIYKEAVNNILKHSRAKEVLIAIAIVHHQLVLSIRDDGVGFDTGKVSHRHGLESIKTRVKRWNGKIQVDTAINEGTSLYIALPLVN
ncbi:MAG TPA: two-component regulator propeller domain-containing protein, partial [Chitinophagaceae bacterium]|nr:two-component regulator propeller domain-containing protein [Chitinophagaceae bacterium]